MDGRVLAGAFSKEYVERFPVVFGDPADPATGRIASGGYTDEGEREIMDRLEGLGYLG
jgi:hypothetical protein